MLRSSGRWLVVSVAVVSAAVVSPAVVSPAVVSPAKPTLDEVGAHYAALNRRPTQAPY